MKNNLNLTKPQLWSFRHFPWAKIEGLRQQGGKTFLSSIFCAQCMENLFIIYSLWSIAFSTEKKKLWEKVKFFAFFLSPHLFFSSDIWFNWEGFHTISLHFFFKKVLPSTNGTSYIKFCKLPRVTWRISPRGFCVWKVYDRATVCQSFLSLLYTQRLTCN